MGKWVAPFALVLLAGVRAQADVPLSFQENAFAWIPWAETVEAAKERAKKEDRLILAFVFPWDDKAHEAGYAAADRVKEGLPPATPAELENKRRTDPGCIKEQAVLTAWLGDPDVSAIVKRSFVPVRLRMHTWHFFDGGPGPFPDALVSLGTSDRETRPPAIVFSTPEGKTVHRAHRLGVFSPHLFRATLLAVLSANARFRPPGPAASADFRAAVTTCAQRGDLAEAKKRLATPPEAEKAWAALELNRLRFWEGDLGTCEESLKSLPASTDRDALLGAVLLRRGKHAEVADLASLKKSDDGSAALAFALERLGKVDESRELWRKVLAAQADGPLGARARLHLESDGPLAREWETLADAPCDPLAATTMVGAGGAGGDVAAVRYLLSQQDADGSWKDARQVPGPDLSVPRTALCACALRAWRVAVPGKATDDAISKAIEYVQTYADRPADRVWDLTYALHLLLDLYAEKKSDATKRRVKAVLEGIARTEHDGAWTYTGPARLHTFNTAPILLLRLRAKELGFDVGPAEIERPVRFLERNRVEKSSVFHYGTTMEHMSGQKGSTDLKSTAMRTPLCELALSAAAGKKDTKRLVDAVQLFFDNQAAARATQKIFESYVDVTSLQDSYRYFFGVWYAAQAVMRLPDAKRKKSAAKIDALVRAEQEADGSFVDSQMVGKPSSTALALLALAEVAPALR